MPRDRMYVRRFLNEPGHHGGAYLLLSVPDTEARAGATSSPAFASRSLTAPGTCSWSSRCTM